MSSSHVDGDTGEDAETEGEGEPEGPVLATINSLRSPESVVLELDGWAGKASVAAGDAEESSAPEPFAAESFTNTTRPLASR